MLKVIILNHGNFTDKQSGVEFKEEAVTIDGARVYLGVAHVDSETVEKYFAEREGFLIESVVTLSEAAAPVATSNAPALTPPAATAAASTASDEAADVDDEWYTAEQLEAMTVADLKLLAKNESIDIGTISKKDELIKCIILAGQE